MWQTKYKQMAEMHKVELVLQAALILILHYSEGKLYDNFLNKTNI